MQLQYIIDQELHADTEVVESFVDLSGAPDNDIALCWEVEEISAIDTSSNNTVDINELKLMIEHQLQVVSKNVWSLNIATVDGRIHRQFTSRLFIGNTIYGDTMHVKAATRSMKPLTIATDTSIDVDDGILCKTQSLFALPLMKKVSNWTVQIKIYTICILD